MRHLLLLIISILLTNCAGKDDRAVREASQLLTQRQYSNARAVIEQALRADPKNPKLLRLQVRYFLCTEQPAFAAAASRKLIELQPADNTLRNALDDPAPAVRITAVRALGELKNPDTLAALTKAAADPEQSVRQAATQSLDKLNTPATIPALKKLLHDSDWFTRGNAALALGKIGNADCAGELFKSLDDSDAYVRKNIRLSLRRLATKENQAAYRAALTAQSPATRTLAALILADAGDTTTIPVLTAELNNLTSPDLPEIIQALVKLNAPDILPGLQTAATSPDRKTSINAILALGDYKAQSAIELLKSIQKNPQTDREVKTACLIALNKIGKKSH